MKVFVQIPCLNEANTVSAVIEGIPQRIPGIDSVTSVLIDDGSNDESVAVAREAGVDYVLHARHEGLGPTFFRGLGFCLSQGADIVVNTDADGQYPSDHIPTLIEPILSGSADLVVARRVMPENYYTAGEKIIKKLGSRAVCTILGVDVVDPVSGFRAFSRSFADILQRNTRFSYTLDTLAQARGLKIANPDVPTNYVERNCRLRARTTEYLRLTALDLYYAVEQVGHKKRTRDRLGLAT